jgi:hypothetical protein
MLTASPPSNIGTPLISHFKFILAVQEKVPNDSHISDFGAEWNGQDMFEISNLK